MNEARLRASANLALFGITAAVFLILTIQNLRYGLYELFYLGLAGTGVALAAGIYTYVRRRQAPDMRALQGAVATLMAIGALALFNAPDIGSHWALPALLLPYVALPSTRAWPLSIAAWLLLTLVMLVSLPWVAAITVAGCAALLVLFTGRLAHRYENATISWEELSIIDPLTGAYNARYFDEVLPREMSRADASGNPLSVLLVEIDYFPQLREQRGPSLATDVSIALAHTLATMIRAGDSHYFEADGRFWLILPFTPEEGCRVIAERIRRRAEETEWPLIDRLTLSIGATTHVSTDHEPATLIDRCRSALKEAQDRGANRVAHTRG